MRKIMTAVMLGLFCVWMTACGNKETGKAAVPKATETPEVAATTVPERTATPEPTATMMPVPTEIPIAEESALDAFQAEISFAGDLCGVAYLGCLPYDYSEFMNYLEANGFLEDYPFLADLKEENTVLASGDEWYVIVPAADDLTVTVSESVLSEITYDLVAGKEYLRTNGSQPILLRGNVSDIFPSFLVTVVDGSGETIEYGPGLSLKDGLLNRAEGVYEFSVEE